LAVSWHAALAGGKVGMVGAAGRFGSVVVVPT
jgi:hypothetical protein